MFKPLQHRANEWGHALKWPALSFAFCCTLACPGRLGGSPIAAAMEAGRTNEVFALIHAGTEVGAAQADGTRAIHWAAYHADAQCLALLLANGADPNASNRYGSRPLSLACLNGDLSCVQMLLAAGADPNEALPGGETPLMTAARTGSRPIVDLLLNAGVQVNEREHHHQTALIWAAHEGHADVVRRLVEAGGDVHDTLPSGFTAIHFAARQGHWDVVDLLLDEGVDPNVPIQSEKRQRFGPLNNTTPLILALENGYFDLGVELMRRGADPNDARTGYSALHTMTWVRKPDIGDNEGSDPAPPVRGRLTSLEFVHELVARGADVNQQVRHGKSSPGKLNSDGMTPFFMAAVRADVDLMRVLVENGADPFVPNADGATALMAAAGVGRGPERDMAGNEKEAIAAAAYCLELGLDINAVDDNGETAMHGAAYGQWPGMVSFLRENGADVAVWNRLNKWKWSPLLIAQGYRAGNFKPSYETVVALETILDSEKVSLRFDPPGRREGYEN